MTGYNRYQKFRDRFLMKFNVLLKTKFLRWLSPTACRFKTAGFTQTGMRSGLFIAIVLLPYYSSNFN